MTFTITLRTFAKFPFLGGSLWSYQWQIGQESAHFQDITEFEKYSRDSLDFFQSLSRVGPKYCLGANLCYFARKWQDILLLRQMGGSRCHQPRKSILVPWAPLPFSTQKIVIWTH